MREFRNLPVQVRALVVAVVAAGGAVLAIQLPQTSGWSHGDLLAAVALAGALALANEFALSLRHETELENFDLTDAFLMAGLLLVRPSVLTAAVAVGTIVGQAPRRWASFKIAFNVGQNLVGIAAAEGIFRLLHAPPAGEPSAWLAGSLAMLAFFAVNSSSIGLVIARMEGRPVRSVLLPTLGLDLVHWTGNVAIGILIARVWAVDRRVLPVLIVPMVMSWLAYRAWLHGVREGNRMRYLFESGRSLSGSLSENVDFRPFLKLVMRMLEADDAQLAVVEGQAVRLHDPNGTVLLRADDASGGPEAYVRPRPGLASHQAVIGEGQDRRGILAVYRRRPLSEPERSLVDTLARQIDLKLENGRLFLDVVDQRAHLANLVANTTDGIIALDSTRAVLSWNPAMERITGFPTGEALGRNLDDLLGTSAGGEVATSPTTRQVDAEIVRSDGTRGWIRCSINRPGRRRCPGRRGRRGPRHHGGARDQRLKADFIATISHELRTPLTPLKGFLVALKQGTVADSPEARDEYYDIMLHQTERLERLIGNPLDVSQIEANQLAIQPEVMDVNHLLVREADARTASDPAHPIQVRRPELPVFVRGDEVRVKEVFSHLLSNAQKFSPPDSSIEVRVERNGSTATVAVTDRGPGVPRSERDRIFALFHRVDNGPTRSTGGTGLGLYIARRLVEAMNGRLWHEPAPGGSSTFLFSLPLAGEAAVSPLESLGSETAPAALETARAASSAPPAALPLA